MKRNATLNDAWSTVNGQWLIVNKYLTLMAKEAKTCLVHLPHLFARLPHRLITS